MINNLLGIYEAHGIVDQSKGEVKRCVWTEGMSEVELEALLWNKSLKLGSAFSVDRLKDIFSRELWRLFDKRFGTIGLATSMTTERNCAVMQLRSGTSVMMNHNPPVQLRVGLDTPLREIYRHSLGFALVVCLRVLLSFWYIYFDSDHRLSGLV